MSWFTCVVWLHAIIFGRKKEVIIHFLNLLLKKNYASLSTNAKEKLVVTCIWGCPYRKY